MAPRLSPGRTVVLGAALIVVAMVGSTFVWLSALPGWAKVLLLILALIGALTGWVMTFRDLSPPRNRRR